MTTLAMARSTLITWITRLIIVQVSVALAIASQPQDITFYEAFNSNWKGRWFVTKASDYKGKWKYEKSQGHDDFGLVVSEKAKKYGILYNLPHIVNPNEETLTLQYDVRFQEGIDCGGAYLKFILPKDDENESNDIDNETPYSIMFGADKCGSTNKVHFIFQHKNPINGKFVEHHMRHPALVEVDRFTHVYTATIYPNANVVKVFVDGELAKICNFTNNDFEPLLIPPLMIADPGDKKPTTWDERPKIPDPNAIKPEDWNEDEPRQIVDRDAKKPEGWLEDEPEEIDDLDSTKPLDWNDEEDGEWKKEKIDNPKCENVPGCGPWKPPMKNNPLYKGKWSAPLIDNPNYNGIWEAKQIPNPNYYHIERPQFEKIGRVGIEIWTMDHGIIFDNILITNNESFASEIRNQTWGKKIRVEKKIEDGESEKLPWIKILKNPFLIKEKFFEGIYGTLDWFTNHFPFLEEYKYQIVLAVKKIEENSLLIIGIFGTIPIFFISIHSLKYAKKDFSKFMKKEEFYERKKKNPLCSDSIVHKIPNKIYKKMTNDKDLGLDCYNESKSNEKFEKTSTINEENLYLFKTNKN